MKTFNGNAHIENTVYVPAAEYMHVADVIRALTQSNAATKDLFVAVREGELQLGDETGSYGIHCY